MSPLNTNTLALPIIPPVSGSRKTLCISTFLFIKLGLAAVVSSIVIPLSSKAAVSSSESSVTVKLVEDTAVKLATSLSPVSPTATNFMIVLLVSKLLIM